MQHKQKRHTSNRLRQILKYLQRAGHNSRPALPHRLRNRIRFDLHECAQRDDSKPLVVDPGQLVVGVDSGKPFIEERAGGAWGVLFHEVERGGGVVEDGVDENLEVGETEGSRFGGVDVVESSLHDGLEQLERQFRGSEVRIRRGKGKGNSVRRRCGHEGST